MPRASTAPKAASIEEEDFDGFLSEEQVEDIATDSKAVSRYVNVSKLEADKPHKYRFIGRGITGHEGWTPGDNGKNKPVRFRIKPDPLPDYLAPNRFTNQVEIKRFTAGVVWDYQDKCLKILLLTQSSLQEKLTQLIQDEDWGNPQKYDIKITRTGSGNETRYSMSTVPHKPVPEEAKEAYAAATIDLDAIFDGRDPFDPNSKADGPLDDEDD